MTVGREVWSVYGDLSKLLVYDPLKQVRRRRFWSFRVDYSSGEVSSTLPVGGKVTEELRLQQGTVTTVFSPTSGHVVCTADFDGYDVGPV